MLSMETNTNEQCAKNIWLIQDFSKNSSIKVLSEYRQLLGCKCRVFFFFFFFFLFVLFFHFSPLYVNGKSKLS